MTTTHTTASQWRCAECGGAHGPDRRCDGALIDWQARRERAQAFTRAWAAAKPSERERMRYDYDR